MYQLGLVSISFRGHTPEELIAAVKDAGLTCIEWGSDVHAPCTNETRLREIAAAQTAAGITCCSYGTYFRLGQNEPAELLDYIKAAKVLGTNILRLWCGTKGSEEFTAEELDNFYEECRRVAKIGEDNGVVFCMECHNNTLTDRKEPALALMQAIDSPAFRMYWQPNQLRTKEENLAYAKLLSPWTEHLHVFNWDCPNGGPLEKYPLDGAVNTWQEYLEQLSGDRCLLLEFMPDDKLETLNIEADALRKIVGA